MSAPRLGEIYRDAHTFYGTYRGHYVEVDRLKRGRSWRFCVTNQAGEKLADGMADAEMTQRAVVVHAVTGAQLFTPPIAKELDGLHREQLANRFD